MPCLDGGYAREDNSHYREKINYLTDLLCKQCTEIEENFSFVHMHPEVLEWWKEHKEEDKKRLRAERLRKKESIQYKKTQMKELQEEIEELSSDLDLEEEEVEEITDCEFSIAWVGKCKNLGTNGFCEEHAKEMCRCGRKAMKSCDATIGAFVCGAPLCEYCRCH